MANNKITNWEIKDDEITINDWNNSGVLYFDQEKDEPCMSYIIKNFLGFGDKKSKVWLVGCEEYFTPRKEFVNMLQNLSELCHYDTTGPMMCSSYHEGKNWMGPEWRANYKGTYYQRFVNILTDIGYLKNQREFNEQFGETILHIEENMIWRRRNWKPYDNSKYSWNEIYNNVEEYSSPNVFYDSELFKLRLKNICRSVIAYKPKLIIIFGVSLHFFNYFGKYIEILPTSNKKISIFKILQTDTIICKCCHPNTRGLTLQYWEDVSNELKKLSIF